MEQYNELPTIMTRERTKPLYDRITEQAQKIRGLEREVQERRQAAALVESMALQALQFGNNHEAVRQTLRDIVTRARRDSK
jgi:hypothetical protein